jgi:hypothetical protein
MDFNGVERARFTAHKAKVNFISADAAGQYVASCSDDGRVVIHTIGGKEWSSHNYYRPVKSVCVDPTFGTKRDRVFATGGLAGKFIINKRGWFTSQDVILHEGEVRRKEGRKKGHNEGRKEGCVVLHGFYEVAKIRPPPQHSQHFTSSRF